MLSNWWKNTFGLRIRQQEGRFSEEELQRVPPRFTQSYFSDILRDRQAYEDDLVLLFCCLCRSLGLRCRLVRSISTGSVYDRGVEGSKDFVYIPSNWAEVWHSVENKWIPVDCIRAIVNCRQSMEMGSPSTKSKTNPKQHIFVVGSDNYGLLTDVTKRYCSKYYGQTWKLRQPDESHLLGYLHLINNQSPRSFGGDECEQAELEAYTESEPLPTTLAAFTGHGKFVLEGKLKKYEVFSPESKPAGAFKDENIWLRTDLRKVRSKEAWYTQFARTLKDGAEPVKIIQLPKKRKRGMLAPDEDPYEPGAMQPLYGEWQTEPYIPPRAENGKVPRNSHGNVDLFQPEMLPLGCAYIPYTGVWRSAKDLGVDYADACVRFAFHGRMAVPNLQGIVVCREHEQRVLAHYFKRVEEDLQADNAEMARQELLKKRREAVSIKIAGRLQEEYAVEDDVHNEQKNTIQSAFSTSRENSEDEDFSFD